MTIFAWDGNSIVADRAEFKYGVVVNAKSEKIFTFSHHGVNVVVTGAGAVSDILAIRNLVQEEITQLGEDELDVCNFQISNTEKYEKVMADMDNYDCLVVLSDGINKVGYYLGQRPYPIKVYAPYAGGHQDTVLVALGAMHAGAKSKEAVQIAVKLTCVSQVSAGVDQVYL